MRNLILSATLMVASLFGATAHAEFEAGKQYVELNNPVQIAKPGKIEVGAGISVDGGISSDLYIGMDNFEQLLAGWLNQGHDLVTMGELHQSWVATKQLDKIAVLPLTWGEIPNRSGELMIQPAN